VADDGPARPLVTLAELIIDPCRLRLFRVVKVKIDAARAACALPGGRETDGVLEPPTCLIDDRQG
jgi:hypothetical protein